MKTGLLHADVINTVSETYANEIRTDDKYGAGLKNVLAKRKNDLYGIVNGIDTRIWNPEKDKLIPKKFTLKNIESKHLNKRELTEKFGFEYDEKIPVIGVISRLYDSKGVDLISKALPSLMKLNIQMVLLGTGDKKYHTLFEKTAKKYSNKFACYLGFNDELAHLIEAGSDIFLMPSKYEPCGLNQMYSLMYGTVPVVRETGGLADTVKNYSKNKSDGNGFMFKKYNAEDMLKEIKKALKIFQNKEEWQKLMKNGMKSDFSWNSSAKKYVELYKTVINN